MAEEIKNEQQQPAAVTNKRTDPPGVMRKSIQSWVILAIAVLMLLVIWLSGGTKAKPASLQNKPSPATANLGGTPEDIAARLLAEQREQARNSITQARNTPNLLNPNLPSQPPAPVPTVQEQQLQQPQQIDPIAEDQRKRKYTSLFSSSVALSYREPQTKALALATQQPTPEQLAAAIAGLPITPYPPPQPPVMELPNQTGSLSSSPAPVSTSIPEHRSLPANANQSSG